MVWSGYAVLMSGKTDSIKLNKNPGCLPGSTFVYSEVFKLELSSASSLFDRIGSAMTSCSFFFNQLALISSSCNKGKNISRICSEKARKNLARKSNRKTKILVSVPDDRYAVFNGSEYAILISLNEYAVLETELDTPYPMEVDTAYSTVDQNSVFKKTIKYANN
ncbi:hypothetical protein Tco_0753543 [Tanacetum coccineum]